MNAHLVSMASFKCFIKMEMSALILGRGTKNFIGAQERQQHE